MKSSVHKSIEDVAVIDIEASGFGRSSYPIELGIVLPDGTRYQSLIKPEPSWLHWDINAQALHGISRNSLYTHGRTVEEVCRDINAICGGVTLYSDCWIHDSFWFSVLFSAAKMPPLARCCAIEYILNDDQQTIYQQLKEQTALKLGLPSHRALNDALVIQQTLRDLCFVPSAAAAPLHRYAVMRGNEAIM